MKGTIVLKDGATFDAEMDDDRAFSANSLTENTIQSFLNEGKTQQLIVQGNQIRYIIMERGEACQTSEKQSS